MNKILKLLLACMLCISLIGCSSDSGNSNDSSSEGDNIETLDVETVLEEKRDDLILTYGIFDDEQEGVSTVSSHSWFHSTGIISATILDFDSDGVLEMLACIAEEQSYDNGTYYPITLYMYEVVSGEAVVQDSMIFMPYDLDTSLYEYISIETMSYMGGLFGLITQEIDGEYCLACLLCYETVLTGNYAGFEANWLLEYKEGKLQYIGSQTLCRGSIGNSIVEYGFDDGDNSSTTTQNFSIDTAWDAVIEFYAEFGLDAEEAFDNYEAYHFITGQILTGLGGSNQQLYWTSLATVAKEEPSFSYSSVQFDFTLGTYLLYSDEESEDTSDETDAIDIELETAYIDEDYYEYGIVYAYDSDGNLIWSYNTGYYTATDLEAIKEIGLRDDCYYLNESGTVVALDVSTGEVVWENSDFGSRGSAAFAEDCICLAGYHGPDFYAISYDGTTLCEIDSFGSDYYWASNVKISNNIAIVSLNESNYKAYVNLTTWEYTILEAD